MKAAGTCWTVDRARFGSGDVTMLLLGCGHEWVGCCITELEGGSRYTPHMCSWEK